VTTAKRDLKSEQATAAHTLDRHVSVTAGPGSGKTTVLVERYLHILRENKNLNIDQIVAITFTNRAANEMRERLRKDLDRILSNCDHHERQRWMRYKRTLDSAVIGTIHGFCAHLLREFPVEARVDPQFLLLDSHDAAILLEAAVEESLTEFISKEREAISQLAVGFGRAKVAEALVALYQTIRGQGLRLDEVARLTTVSHSTVVDYKQALAELDRTMNEFIGCKRLTPNAEKKRAHAAKNWPALREVLQRERPPLAEYCAAIENFRASARPRIDSLPGIAERLDEQLFGETKDGPFGTVPQLCFDLYAREYAQELIQVLKEIERRYREKKQTLTALDFDDLQLRALELLEQPAVLARATRRYRYFLVDEFQDTNSIQRELMHRLALSAPASHANLFIVGDRKQSIYGFRGADVDVFQQTTKALTEAGGIVQPLHLNFRSQPQLISFFNSLFERLFQPEDRLSEDERAQLGFVEFENSIKQREELETSPLVELLIDSNAPAEEDPRSQRTAAERDAKQVAQRIRSLIDDNAVQYRDIALLFRAMTNVSTYEATFRRFNIPFQTVQGKGFYEREEITDLIQLLRFLDNKTDEIALAAVLRSPLGGISDNALLALRCAPWLDQVDTENATRYFNKPRKLLYALHRQEQIAYIDEDERLQLDRVSELLNRLLERRNHYPLADLLRFAVEETEYMTVIAANFDGAQKLANVQKLFALAERFEHSGAYLIRDLVRYIEEFEEIGSREGEGQIDDSADAVRLMSIHQAKGLEFPVVIIPALHQRSIKPQEHWFALDRHCGLTVKVPDGRSRHVAGYTLAQFRERSKFREHFESVRLLYVAATRAQDRLILSGVTEGLTKLNGSRDNWLKLIWQKLEIQAAGNCVIELEPDTRLQLTLNLAEESTAGATVLPPPAEASHEPAGSLSLEFPLLQPVAAESSCSHQFSVTQLLNYRRCPRQYYFDRILHVPQSDNLAVWNDAESPEPPGNLTATLKGAVIHRFCETYERGESAETRLRQSLDEEIGSRRTQLADRLSEINREAAIGELLPLAQNYLSSRVFQRVQRIASSRDKQVAAEGPGLYSELRFRLRRPLGFVTGSIDKLLVSSSPNSDGYVIEIIDFKTNRLQAHEPNKTTDKDRDVLSTTRSNRVRSSPDQFAFDFSSAAEHKHANVSDSEISKQVVAAAADYQLQMQAYALAIRELLPELCATSSIEVTLHFLQPNIEFHLEADQLESDVCASAVDDAIRRIVSSVEPEQFPVQPAAHCRMCNFLEVCSAGREWLSDFQKARVLMLKAAIS
jgi:ATP-dependent helicase/nuclease subunit A